MTDVDLNGNIYRDMFAAMQKLKLTSSTSREQCIEELNNLLKETFKEEISKSVSSSFTDRTMSENEAIEENLKKDEIKKDLNATESVTDSRTKLCVGTPGLLSALYASPCSVNLNTKHKKKGEFSSYVNFEEFVDVPENEKKWCCNNQLNEHAIKDTLIETSMANIIDTTSTSYQTEKEGLKLLKKENLYELYAPPPHLEEAQPTTRKIDDATSEACSSVESSLQWDCCELPERLLINLKESKILSKKDLQILTTYCWCSYYAHKELSARNARSLYLKRLKDLCHKCDEC